LHHYTNSGTRKNTSKLGNDGALFLKPKQTASFSAP